MIHLRNTTPTPVLYYWGCIVFDVNDSSSSIWILVCFNEEENLEFERKYQTKSPI